MGGELEDILSSYIHLKSGNIFIFVPISSIIHRKISTIKKLFIIGQTFVDFNCSYKLIGSINSGLLQ